MHPHLIRLLALATLIACTNATAALITLNANLTVTQEVGAGTPNPLPPAAPVPLTDNSGNPRPVPFGTATFLLNTATPTITMTATVFNLDFTAQTNPASLQPGQTPFTNDDMTRAHIHLPAPPGQTAGIIWPIFESNFDALANNADDDDLVITPFATGLGGTISAVWEAGEGLTQTVINQILNGLAYLNFHTVQFPAGEVRGQLVVPEPSTIALLALALAGIFLTQRQRKELKRALKL